MAANRGAKPKLDEIAPYVPNQSTPQTKVVTGESSLPGIAAPTVQIKANLFQEYVAGNNGLWYHPTSFMRTLPPYIDDLTQAYGADLYERMQNDSKVASSINLLKQSILAQDLHLLPAVNDEEQDGFELANEILEFCDRNLTQRLDQPIEQVLWSLLDGLAAGNKVAEQTYEVIEDGSEDDGKLCLKSIKVKARYTTAYVMDAFGNMVALLGLLPGGSYGSIITQGMLAFAPSGNGMKLRFSPNNILPREKFIVFTFRPVNNDPRGSSILRAAYTPWWQKQQALQEYQKYLSQFASPSLVGTTPEGAQPVPQTDSNGNLILDGNGIPYQTTPEQIMTDALLNFQNGTVVTLPYGSTVTPLQMSGAGEPFLQAIEYADKQIDQAITGQTLSTGEADHQTGAATSAHQDVKDLVVTYARNTICRTLKRDCLYHLVRYNYGEEAARKFTPDLSLTLTEQQDFATNAEAVARLWSIGYLDVSQQPKLDAMLNLPERSKESMLDPANAQPAQIQQVQQEAGTLPTDKPEPDDNEKPKEDESPKDE